MIFILYCLLSFWFGIITWLKPSFSASLILFSMFVTGLISPPSPSSPITIVFFGIGLSFRALKIERATARSIAGSFILKPPTILRWMSWFVRLRRARLRSTAEII